LAAVRQDKLLINLRAIGTADHGGPVQSEVTA